MYGCNLYQLVIANERLAKPGRPCTVIRERQFSQKSGERFVPVPVGRVFLVEYQLSSSKRTLKFNGKPAVSADSLTGSIKFDQQLPWVSLHFSSAALLTAWWVVCRNFMTYSSGW